MKEVENMRKEEDKLRLLFALIKGARRSDRELARALGTSQPTITRKRTKLEKEGFIKEYTVIPNLRKMGYEIIAFTFLAFREAKPELMEKAREWTRRQPCVIFASDCEGLGMNSVMISLHRDYASFSRLISNLRQDWQPNIKDVQNFILSVNRPELLVKAFSFQYLEANK